MVFIKVTSFSDTNWLEGQYFQNSTEIMHSSFVTGGEMACSCAIVPQSFLTGSAEVTKQMTEIKTLFFFFKGSSSG